MDTSHCNELRMCMYSKMLYSLYHALWCISEEEW